MNIEQEIKELIAAGYVEGELSIDPFWYIIWEPENLKQYNEEYEVSKYAPGFTAFGSNGGNELLAIDASGNIYSLPAIGMEPKYAEKIAENFNDLKQYMENAI